MNKTEAINLARKLAAEDASRDPDLLVVEKTMEDGSIGIWTYLSEYASLPDPQDRDFCYPDYTARSSDQNPDIWAVIQRVETLVVAVHATPDVSFSLD